MVTRNYFRKLFVSWQSKKDNVVTCAILAGFMGPTSKGKVWEIMEWKEVPSTFFLRIYVHW